jgi:hypothetical protein
MLRYKYNSLPISAISRAKLIAFLKGQTKLLLPFLDFPLSINKCRDSSQVPSCYCVLSCSLLHLHSSKWSSPCCQSHQNLFFFQTIQFDINSENYNSAALITIMTSSLSHRPNHQKDQLSNKMILSLPPHLTVSPQSVLFVFRTGFLHTVRSSRRQLLSDLLLRLLPVPL